MKKCLGVALALCLLLTACGGETVQTPEQGGTTVPEEEAQTPEREGLFAGQEGQK